MYVGSQKHLVFGYQSPDSNFLLRGCFSSELSGLVLVCLSPHSIQVRKKEACDVLGEGAVCKVSLTPSILLPEAECQV